MILIGPSKKVGALAVHVIATGEADLFMFQISGFGAIRSCGILSPVYPCDLRKAVIVKIDEVTTSSANYIPETDI